MFSHLCVIRLLKINWEKFDLSFLRILCLAFMQLALQWDFYGNSLETKLSVKATAHSSRTKVEIFLNTRKAKKATEGRGSNGNGQRSLILAHVHKTSRANTHTHTKQQLWVRIAACSLYTAVTAFLQIFLTSKKSACCLNVLWVKSMCH